MQRHRTLLLLVGIASGLLLTSNLLGCGSSDADPETGIAVDDVVDSRPKVIIYVRLLADDYLKNKFALLEKNSKANSVFRVTDTPEACQALHPRLPGYAKKTGHEMLKSTADIKNCVHNVDDASNADCFYQPKDKCELKRPGKATIYVPCCCTYTVGEDGQCQLQDPYASHYANACDVCADKDHDSITSDQREQALAELMKATAKKVQETHPNGFSAALVFSAHSVGTYNWGENGGFYMDRAGKATDMRTLFGSQEMKAFSENVNNLYLLQCYAGKLAYVDQWRAPFPRMVSVLGFNKSGPGGEPAWAIFSESYSVVKNLNLIDAQGGFIVGPTGQTLTPARGASLASQLVHGARAGWSWTAARVISYNAQGHEVGAYYDSVFKIALSDLRVAYSSSKPKYELWFNAADANHADPPVNTSESTNEIRQHYNNVQEYISALQDPSVPDKDPGGQDPTLDTLKGVYPQAIRLIFFQGVKDAWLKDADNQEALTAWLAAKKPKFEGADLTAEVIKGLSRQKTLQLIQELQTALPNDQFVVRLDNAFRLLTEKEIPTEWI